MKWTFANVGLLIFGLFGIIIISFFNDITISNEQDYYTLKEAVEASMIEAVDITYFRLTGGIKINQEKFVENFTRRFTEVARFGEGNYNIEFYDISETPPKVSVRIIDATATYNIFGTFGVDPSKAFVVNEISAILDVYGDGENDAGEKIISIIPVNDLSNINVPSNQLPTYEYDDQYYQSSTGESLSDIDKCEVYDDRIECYKEDGSKVVLDEVSDEVVEEILPENNTSNNNNNNNNTDDEPTVEEPGNSGNSETNYLNIQVYHFESFSYTKTTLIFFKDTYKIVPKYNYYLMYNGGTYVPVNLGSPPDAASSGKCTMSGSLISCPWNGSTYTYKKVNGLSYTNSPLRCFSIMVNDQIKGTNYLANNTNSLNFYQVGINYDRYGFLNFVTDQGVIKDVPCREDNDVFNSLGVTSKGTATANCGRLGFASQNYILGVQNNEICG